MFVGGAPLYTVATSNILAAMRSHRYLSVRQMYRYRLRRKKKKKYPLQRCTACRLLPANCQQAGQYVNPRLQDVFCGCGMSIVEWGTHARILFSQRLGLIVGMAVSMVLQA